MSLIETPTTDRARPANDSGIYGFRGIEIVRGEGSYVFDADDRRWFDATSQYGAALLGHAHPAIAAAITDQAQRLISCFGSYANDRRTALYERLARHLAPLDRFFLCNSGTEAVEGAIKFARRFTNRHGVVALSNAFHGRTMGALSATFRSKHRDAFQPLLDHFHHVRPGDLEGLETHLATGEIGLFLVELVQGEGGLRPVDLEFLRQARELCRTHGVLFCVDEVQTGPARTGRWFGFQHADLQPDLVCMAKGLGGGVPIGAVAYSSEHGPFDVGSHGSTFGGNPLACAAACAVLDTIESEGLVEQVHDHGERLLSFFTERLGDSDRVRAIRGRGLMLGLELVTPSVPVQQRLQERGYLTLGAGPRVLRLLPPINTPWNELEELATACVEEILS